MKNDPWLEGLRAKVEVLLRLTDAKLSPPFYDNFDWQKADKEQLYRALVDFTGYDKLCIQCLHWNEPWCNFHLFPVTADGTKCPYFVGVGNAEADVST